MEVSMKRCPFCNSERVFPQSDTYGDEPDEVFWCVSCEECMCCGPVEDTEQAAIEEWNKRAEREGLYGASYQDLMNIL